MIPQEDEYKEDFEEDEGGTIQKKPKKAKSFNIFLENIKAP